MQRDGNHPRPGREPPVRLADILGAIAGDETRTRVSIAELMAAMDERAIGALLFVFAAPNAVPLPPGASTVLGAPLLFLTAQLALGRRAWLPGFITRRTIERIHLAAMMNRVAPALARAERLLRPRWLRLVRPPAEYLIGTVCFLLSLVLFLPIPMGNMPPALAICMFALAILEEDGLWVVFGCCTAVAALALISGVLFALVESATFMLAKFIA